jgi:hypothetical protein
MFFLVELEMSGARVVGLMWKWLVFARGGIAALAVCYAGVVWGTPKVLEPSALSSPSRRCKANVEWEDIGFIGVIRMNLYHPNGDPWFSVELPEINPSPANLMWIDDEWIGCESFLGDRGSGFFYVHVPTQRGYLVDIIAPRPDADWVLNFSTNDRISTSSIRTISRDRDSLFPILLRDLPTEGPDYFTTDFCNDVRDAVDAYTSWRKKEKIRDMEFLGEADLRTSVGVLTVATIDQVPSAVYFPAGTTTTADMLDRVRHMPLPAAAQHLLLGVDAPIPRPKWTDNKGAFVIEAVDTDTPTSVTILMNGKFDNVHDEPYVRTVGSAVVVDVTSSSAEKPKKPIPAAKDKPPRSKSSKRPSRAK